MLPPTTINIFGAISADPYTAPLISKALELVAPQLHVTNVIHDPKTSDPHQPLLQILPYEAINFEHHLSHPSSSLANSYIIRKALIRKHYLWHTASSWWSKHPEDTALKNHIPLTVTFELDFAEFLDDALVECFELHESFAKDEREWWMLKPAMSDQGQGVRLFSTFAELQAIFDEWEPPDDEDEGGEDDQSAAPPNSDDGDDEHIAVAGGTMTSQLRHFVAQRYIDPPLLFPGHGNRKFHIRTYVLAVGALKVYVYREMLALFAPEPYQSPTSSDDETDPTTLDLRIHLTNTCLHSEEEEGEKEGGRKDHPANPEAKVARFWDLPTHPPLSPLPPSSPPSSSSPPEPTNQTATITTTTTDWKTSTFTQICTATATLFEAASREQMIHFQTLPNSFEIFGVDWIVDAAPGCNVWLLEVNAFPDFKQSGSEMKEVVQGLWNGIVDVAVKPFFFSSGERGGRERGLEKGEEKERDEVREEAMVKVLDIDLGRR